MMMRSGGVRLSVPGFLESDQLRQDRGHGGADPAGAVCDDARGGAVGRAYGAGFESGLRARRHRMPYLESGRVLRGSMSVGKTAPAGVSLGNPETT